MSPIKKELSKNSNMPTAEILKSKRKIEASLAYSQDSDHNKPKFTLTPWSGSSCIKPSFQIKYPLPNSLQEIKLR